MKRLTWLVSVMLCFVLLVSPAYAAFLASVQDPTNLPAGTAGDIRVVRDLNRAFTTDGTKWYPTDMTPVYTLTFAAAVQDVTNLPSTDAAYVARVVTDTATLYVTVGSGVWYPLSVVSAPTYSGLTLAGPLNNTSTSAGPGGGYGMYSLRSRVSIAAVNTGTTLLPAVAGRKYRITLFRVIAEGASAISTFATGVSVSGTQSSSVVALYTVPKAALTQSTVNTVNTATTTVLADGASFKACDAATAITFASVGGTDLANSTYIDVILDYTVE